MHGQKVISYVAPTIVGTKKVGYTLTASVGSFSVKPTHYTYQWRRHGTAITHATNPTYKLTTADKGAAISVTVTGTRSGGFTSGSATSASTGPIA
jgi:hypothetical protein